LTPNKVPSGTSNLLACRRCHFVSPGADGDGDSAANTIALGLPLNTAFHLASQNENE
jgi:hypothetical protein